MDKLPMQTPDLTLENFKKIEEFFPNCITESEDEEGNLTKKIDFDILKAELGDKKVVEGLDERYRLDWPGKKRSILKTNTPITKTLRPVKQDSVNWDNTQNLYIEGDNFEVLKILQESYLGEIKMIYIDPPYNTGSDFVYNDNFSEDIEEYKEKTEQDSEGYKVVKNTETKGRFHSSWLSMMYERLKVARDFLKQDGVIFISIDDHEQENLRKICDEIFGDSNFISQLVWQQGRKSMANYIATNHEYCLVYAKDIGYLSEHSEGLWQTKKEGLDKIYSKYDELCETYSDNYEKISEEIKKRYKSLDDSDPSKSSKHYSLCDKGGLFFADNISQGTGKGGRFDIIHPITKKPCKLPSGGWRFSEKKLPELLENDLIYFGKDETTVPCLKRYLKNTEYEVPQSVFYKDGRGASKRLQLLFDGYKIFDFPKDEYIIQEFINYCCRSEDTILDFFSGSATTANACMLLNASDGGHRKYIMVQLPELTDENSEAYKAGYRTICEIGKERIRRSAKKIKEESNADIDYGFRVYKVDETCMKDVYYHPSDIDQGQLKGLISNIKEDRSPEDLLTQIILNFGLTLDLPIEEKAIGKNKLFYVAGNSLIACFDENIDNNVIDEIIKQKPRGVVLRDSCFTDDQALDNFELKVHSVLPNTEIKII